MSKSDNEYCIDDEVKYSNGFVVNQSVSAFEQSDHDVIYRRNNVETQFMTSHFDSQPDNGFAQQASEKVMFSDGPATLQDLEDGVSTVQGPDSMLGLSQDFAEQSDQLQVFVPTGEVPDAYEMGYFVVNPMFESRESPDTVLRCLHKAMSTQHIEFSCNFDWTMDARALIAAEEILFSVQLHRMAKKSIVHVDFSLRSGDELNFLRVTDSIRMECRTIDKDMIGLPKLSFDILADWSTPEAFLPDSFTVDLQELSMLLHEINSDSLSFTRYEVVKRLKDLCQYDFNRRAFADYFKEQFVTGLQSMLQDDNDDIVRYAIYTILKFTDDISTLNGLELPRLPETLCDIMTLSPNKSTKKFADVLYRAITISTVC